MKKIKLWQAGALFGLVVSFTPVNIFFIGLYYDFLGFFGVSYATIESWGWYGFGGGVLFNIILFGLVGFIFSFL